MTGEMRVLVAEALDEREAMMAEADEAERYSDWCCAECDGYEREPFAPADCGEPEHWACSPTLCLEAAWGAASEGGVCWS